MAEETRTDARHPVSRTVAASREAIGGLAETPLWSLSDTEVGETLADVGRLRAQVEELELRLAREAGDRDLGERAGATSTAVAWAVDTRQTRPAAISRMRLADALGRFHLVREALAAGHLHADQARVITETLDRLPTDLEPQLRESAEQHLLIEATRCDAKTLRILGKHLLTVIAPEIGEAADAAALEREERAAAQEAWLTLSDDGRGSTLLRGKMPTLQGGMLRKALQAIAAPKHQRAVNGADDDHGDHEAPARCPSRERLGQALVEYVEGYPAARLPRAGGVAATVVVLVELETLLGGLKAAHLDTGEVLSAAQARRLACEAGVIPAVLGSDGQVLDLGRKTRFHTESQRLAVLVEQRTCRVEGCDCPAHLCHVHHLQPWTRGGHTTVRDAALLCPRHHSHVHDPAYETRMGPAKTITLHRRT